MEPDKQVMDEIARARKDEAHHRKLMEYHQEEIRILKGQMVKGTYKKRFPFIENPYTCKTNCQVCGKDMMILKDAKMFGILCGKCAKGGKIYTKEYGAKK